MGLSLKNARSVDFCADRIDVITNFAVITNAVIKKVNCMLISIESMNSGFSILY